MAVIAEAVRHLIAAGVSGDALVQAIEDMEAAELPQRTARQERNRRYYEKKASEKRLKASYSDTPPPNGSDGFPHPSLTSLTTPPKINPKGFTKGTPSEPEGFSEFWEYFPRQRRGNRDKALRAYIQACARASPAEILTGLNAYISSDEVASGMAKGAQAWLNDDRWANDYKIRVITNGTHRTKPRSNTSKLLEGIFRAGTESGAEQQPDGLERPASGEPSERRASIAPGRAGETAGHDRTFDA